MRHITILVIFLSLSLAGCGGSKDGQAYLDEAKRLIQQGDHTAAIIQLKNALQKDPDNREVRLLLGNVYNDVEQYATAEKELLKARELGASEETIAPQLVTALLGQGELKRLIDTVSPPENATPAVKAAVLVARGKAMLGLNQQNEAKAAFDEALKTAPDYPGVYLGYAQIEVRSGNLQNALQEIERTLEKTPDDTEALLLKGDLLAALGKPVEALAVFTQVARLTPNNLQAQVKQTSIYLSMGKIQEARAAADKARAIAPGNPLVRYTQALVEFRQGNLDEAQTHIAEVLRVAPGNLPANLLAGALAYSLGNYQLAQSHLSKVVNAVPSNAAARKMLAAVELKLGNLVEAEAVLKPFEPAKSDDPDVLGLMGEIRLRAKDFKGASPYLERAARLAPDNSAIRTQLGVSRLGQGETERATADLEAAAGLNANFLKADTILILSHLGKKEYDQALAAIARLEKKAPNAEWLHNFRAMAYLGKKDTAQARKSLERALAINPGFFTAVANLAQMDIADKKPAVAKKRLQDFLAKNPSSTAAMLGLSDFAREAKNEKEYLAWLEKAAAKDGKGLEPRARLTRYWLAKKNPAKALAYAREAVTGHPGNAQALDLLGQTQLAAGDKINAQATYKKLVVLMPASPLAHLRLATAQTLNNEPDNARRSLEQVLKLDATHADALASLALLELSAKHYDRAQSLARQLQKAHPKLAAGYLLDGDAQMARGRASEAVSLFEAAYQRNPSGGLATKLHDAHTSAGNPAKGEAILEQWLKAHPGDLATSLFLAQAQTRRGSLAAAIARYEAIVKQAPGNLVALNNLAGLYQRNRHPNALKTAEAAHKLGPQNPAVLDTLGWILVEQGQTARGLGYLREALSKMPDQPEVHWHLAYGLYKSGDKARARQELQRLLQGGLAFPQEQEARVLLKQLGG